MEVVVQEEEEEEETAGVGVEEDLEDITGDIIEEGQS